MKLLNTQNTLYELSSFGLLSVRGQDAKTFLQGQITCNVDEMTKDHGLIGAHCNLKGRMQSLFKIFLHPEEAGEPHYLLNMPVSMLNLALQNFKKYALFSKVELSIMNEMVGIGLYGPDTPALISAIASDLGAYAVYKYPGESPHYALYGQGALMKQCWQQWTSVCHIVPSEAAELLEIRAGLPMIYPETVDQILPHHANLSILQGISYNKGCYLGQEIIARMQYRGKLKKHMYRAFVQDTIKPKPGSPVFISGEPTGIVVRSSESEEGGYELLVILEDKYQHFEDVHLTSANGPKLGRLDLPYSLQ